MKAYLGVDIQIRILFTSVFVKGDQSTSRFGRFMPEEEAPSTDWIVGWVGPRNGLKSVEERKFLPPQGLKILPLVCLPHS
jgi:hypothetical protein